jgi:hypothetical protein
MNEIKPNTTYFINNLEQLKNQEDILKDSVKDDDQQFYDSQRSSTSTSSINETNDNLGVKSKLLSKNSENLELFQSQRKFSAPVSYSESFALNFIKIGNDTRGSYFNKLISKGILSSSEEGIKFKFNNIFIFDWDDTLLCTTVLSPGGYFDDNMIVLPSKMEKIKKLEILVNRLLSLTTEKGETYIITNSEPGWVEYSCKRFFPNTFHLLNKIKIISARGLYEKKYPKGFKTWKSMAFNDIIQNYDKSLPTNIMCLGDSPYEIEAAHGLAAKFPNGYVKAIKFREYPKIDELISQLNLVLDKFNFIYSACKNWTITVDKKKKKEGKSN